MARLAVVGVLLMAAVAYGGFTTVPGDCTKVILSNAPYAGCNGVYYKHNAKYDNRYTYMKADGSRFLMRNGDHYGWSCTPDLSSTFFYSGGPTAAKEEPFLGIWRGGPKAMCAYFASGCHKVILSNAPYAGCNGVYYQQREKFNNRHTYRKSDGSRFLMRNGDHYGWSCTPDLTSKYFCSGGPTATENEPFLGTWRDCGGKGSPKAVCAQSELRITDFDFGAKIDIPQPGKITVILPNRPIAHGDIVESPGIDTGFVNFPDDRKYKFWFHPLDGAIYWDADKGSTSNIWHGVLKV